MLDPHSLLVYIKRIEGDMGREQDALRWGPRLIDIDIVFYDDLVMASSELTIPHPRLEGRTFVLAPLVDLDPDYVHPQLEVTVSDLLAQCDLSTATRVSEETDIIEREEADMAVATVAIEEWIETPSRSLPRHRQAQSPPLHLSHPPPDPNVAFHPSSGFW